MKHVQKTRGTLWAILLCLLALLLTGMGIIMGNGRSAEIYTLRADTDAPLLYTEYADNHIFVFNDGLDGVVLLLNEKGEVLAEIRDHRTILKARYTAGLLYLFSESGGMLTVTRLDCNDLDQLRQNHTGLQYMDMRFIDCDSAGNLYYSSYQKPDTVYAANPDGVSTGYLSFNSDISYLEVYQDVIYLHAEDALIAVNPGDLFTYDVFESSLIPYQILNGQYLIDKEGTIADYTSDEKVTPVYACPAPPSARLFHAIGEPDTLFWVSAAKEIKSADMLDNHMTLYETEFSVYAITGSSAVLKKDNKLYFTSFSSFTESEPETSEPGANPSPEPTPSVNLDIEGEYLYIDSGLTISKFKQLFAPEAVQVTKASGELVTSGAVKTGMKVKSYHIIVIGDCNGTGTVNTADTREAQSMFLGTSMKDNVYFNAADMDRDGEVTTADLVKLSDLVSKNQ